MKNEFKQTHNATTGEIIVLEFTDDEQAIRDIENKEWSVEQEKEKINAAQLRQTKISAYKKLGLTDLEIEALLPTPAPIIALSS